MTRAEILNDIIRITNQDYEAVRRMKAHDRSQREEIARLRMALEALVLNIDKIAYRDSANLRLGEAVPAYVNAQAALAKEATRDKAE